VFSKKNVVRLFVAFNIALILTALGFGGYKTYQIGQFVWDASKKAQTTYGYLAEPVAETKDKKPLNRAAIIDAIIKQSVEPKAQTETK